MDVCSETTIIVPNLQVYIQDYRMCIRKEWLIVHISYFKLLSGTFVIISIDFPILTYVYLCKTLALSVKVRYHGHFWSTPSTVPVHIYCSLHMPLHQQLIWYNWQSIRVYHIRKQYFSNVLWAYDIIHRCSNTPSLDIHEQLTISKHTHVKGNLLINGKVFVR